MVGHIALGPFLVRKRDRLSARLAHPDSHPGSIDTFCSWLSTHYVATAIGHAFARIFFATLVADTFPARNKISPLRPQSQVDCGPDA